jgi:hypothetical protein
VREGNPTIGKRERRLEENTGNRERKRKGKTRRGEGDPSISCENTATVLYVEEYRIVQNWVSVVGKTYILNGKWRLRFLTDYYIK